MESKSNSRTESNKNEHSRTNNSQPEVTSISQPAAMATVTQGSNSVSVDPWAASVPKVITPERQVSAFVNQKYWNNFYSRIRISSSNEEVRRKARASVYTYCAVNGTSRAGEYASEVITADGIKYNSSEIAAACNARDIRKWMRANADEAIEFFRSTNVLETIPAMVYRANDLGGSVDSIIGVVDFVSDSPLLHVNEKRLNVASFNVSIQRAAGARGGKSLETVEHDGIERSLAAQDNTSENGNVLKL